jgi:hypothetical protein
MQNTLKAILVLASLFVGVVVVVTRGLHALQPEETERAEFDAAMAKAAHALTTAESANSVVQDAAYQAAEASAIAARADHQCVAITDKLDLMFRRSLKNQKSKKKY